MSIEKFWDHAVFMAKWQLIAVVAICCCAIGFALILFAIEWFDERMK